VDAIENQVKGVLEESENFKNEKLRKIQNTWPKVKESLELIVMHAKALQGVLVLYSRGMIYNWLIGNRYSVETNIGVFDEGIYDGSIVTDIEKYLKVCKFFRDKIISDSSVCNRFFKFYKCDVFTTFENNAYYMIEKAGHRVESSTNFNGTILVDIHDRILESIYFDPIVSNIKSHAAEGSSVFVKWEKSEMYITLSVTCESKGMNKSGENVEIEYLHKKSGLATMKEVGKFYNVLVEHTDFEKPYSKFWTQLTFALSK
jgi:hypothetical protein